MDKDKKEEEIKVNSYGVKRSCHNCMNVCSMQQDVLCLMWCDEQDRDFSFGYTSYDACDKWVED